MKYEEEFRLLLLAKPLELKFKQLEWLYDTKHNICIRKMQIEYNLQVGYVYDFTFEEKENEESSTYSFIVVKKEENNIYYIAEFENNNYCTISENRLGKIWKKCDIAEYGVDLDNCFEIEKAIVENSVKLIEKNTSA